MKSAFVDTSCLVAIAFAEPGAKTLAGKLGNFDRLFATNLLEAELRSALLREGVAGDPAPLLAPLSWVWPDRPLGLEMTKALAAGRCRGADLWHLATALWLSPDPKDLAFVSLDRDQVRVARALGFPAG